MRNLLFFSNLSLRFKVYFINFYLFRIYSFYFFFKFLPSLYILFYLTLSLIYYYFLLLLRLDNFFYCLSKYPFCKDTYLYSGCKVARQQGNFLKSLFRTSFLRLLGSLLKPLFRTLLIEATRKFLEVTVQNIVH